MLLYRVFKKVISDFNNLLYASFSYYFATNIFYYYGLLLQLCTFSLNAVKHVLMPFPS